MVDFPVNVVVDPGRANRGIRQVDRGLGGLEGRANQLGAAFTRAFGALAGGVALGETVRIVADFSQELSTVRAVTGATEQEFARLSATAQELGSTTRFSATQAAEGLTFLARAGFSAEEAIDTIDDTLNLAQAGALDLGRAADIASNVLTAFRLDTAEAARVVDVLALAANSANTDVNQLGDAMRFVAPVAAGLGVDLETATAAVGALSDAGLQASMAGTGLRRVLTELESPAARTREILASLGVSTEEVRISQVGLVDALEALARSGIDTGLALELFGDRGGPAFEVLRTAIPRIRDLTVALDNSEGTAESVARIMDDNLNGALLSVRSAFEGLVLAIGQSGATGALRDVLEAVADGLRFLTENAGTLVNIGETLAIVLGVRLANQVVPALTARFIELGSSIRRNPLGAIATVATVASAALFAFSEEITLVEGSVESLTARAEEFGAFEIPDIDVDALTSSVDDASNSLDQFQSSIDDIDADAFTSQVVDDLNILRRALVNTGTDITTLNQSFADDSANQLVMRLRDLRVAVEGTELGDLRQALLDAEDGAEALNRANFDLIGGFSELTGEQRVVLQGLGLLQQNTVTLGDFFAALGNTAPLAFQNILTSSAAAVTGTTRDFNEILTEGARLVDRLSAGFILLGRTVGIVTAEILISFLRPIEQIGEAYENAFEAIRLVGEGEFADAGRAWARAAIAGNTAIFATERPDFSRLTDALLEEVEELSDFSFFGDLFERTQQEAREIAALRIQAPEVPGMPRGPSAEIEAMAAMEAAAADAAAERARALQDVIDALVQEGELLQLNNREREIQAELLRIIDDFREEGRELTGVEQAEIEGLLRGNQLRADQAMLLEEINREEEQANIRRRARLNLLQQNLITEEQFNEVFERSLDELEREAQLLRQSNREREISNQLRQIEADAVASGAQLTQGQRDALELRLRTNQALEDEVRLRDMVVGSQEEAARQQAALNRLIVQGGENVEDYEAALTELRVRTDEDLAAALQLGQTLFSSLTEELVSFTTTGTASFERFVNSIIASLTRLVAQQALIAAAQALGGEGAGGVIGSIIAGARAEGGPVGGGRTFLVGEKGPELFVPQRSGFIIPHDETERWLRATPRQTGGPVQAGRDFLVGEAGRELFVSRGTNADLVDENLRSRRIEAALNQQAPVVNLQPQNVTVLNVTDEQAALDAISTSNGDRVIVNSIAKNSESIRRTLGIT